MRLIAAMLVLLLCAACAATGPGPATPSPTPSPSPSPEMTRPPLPTDVLPLPTELGSPPGSPVIGEVPDEIMDAIVAEAAELAGVEPGQVSVIRAEQVLWNDGALGCPEPGVVYPQVLIDGYWVVVEAGGLHFDFRVSDRGTFFLCPPGRGGPPIG